MNEVEFTDTRKNYFKFLEKAYSLLPSSPVTVFGVTVRPRGGDVKSSYDTRTLSTADQVSSDLEFSFHHEEWIQTWCDASDGELLMVMPDGTPLNHEADDPTYCMPIMELLEEWTIEFLHSQDRNFHWIMIDDVDGQQYFKVIPF